MQTPNTKAGAVTESVMARIRLKLPKIETCEYNRMYEAVLEAMNEQFPEISKSYDLTGFYDCKSALR